MQEPGSVPGYFEEDAIKSASSALQLSSLPGDQCQADLALGRARLALYHLRLGGRQAAAGHAWAEGDITANVVRGDDVAEVIPPCSRRGNAAVHRGNKGIDCEVCPRGAQQ